MSTHNGQAPERGRPARSAETDGGDRGGRTVEEWNRIDRGEVDDDPLDKSDSTIAGAANEPPD